MKRLTNIFSAALALAQLPNNHSGDDDLKLVIDDASAPLLLHKREPTPRDRVLAYRARTRRPMATAKVVRREGAFFRLSNGTLVRGGNR